MSLVGLANTILVPIWLKVESIAIRILTRFEGKFDDSQPKLGGPRIDRADVEMGRQLRSAARCLSRDDRRLQASRGPREDLARYRILYQPRLGVGIESGGPTRLLLCNRI